MKSGVDLTMKDALIIEQQTSNFEALCIRLKLKMVRKAKKTQKAQLHDVQKLRKLKPLDIF